VLYHSSIGRVYSAKAVGDVKKRCRGAPRPVVTDHALQYLVLADDVAGERRRQPPSVIGTANSSGLPERHPAAAPPDVVQAEPAGSRLVRLTV
jgi:hypothetical protein